MGEAVSGPKGDGQPSALKLDGQPKGKGRPATKGKGGGSRAPEGRSEAAEGTDAGGKERGTAPETAAQPAGQASVRGVEPPAILYPDPTPEPISLDQIRARKQEAKEQAKAPPKQQPVRAPSLRTGIEFVAKALYSVPALAQQGDWWYLSNDEAKTIGEQGEAAIYTLESRKIQAATKLINSIAPWVALVATVAVVTYARVQMTSAAYAKARSLGAPPSPGNQNGGANGDAGVSTSGAAAGSGAAKNRIAERLEGSQG